MIGLVAAAYACGPDYPPYLLGASAEANREPMIGDFDQMIADLAVSDPLPTAVASGWLEVERADAIAGLPPALVAPWLAARAAARKKESFTTPKGLPDEYRLYLEGSASWHRDGCADVRPLEELLALPPEARRNRTTWAEFVLARCLRGEERPAMWHRLRQDAKAGFADRWGLAAWSYGVEALEYGHLPEAFHLYLAQARSDPEGSTSLLLLARDVLDASNDLAGIVQDPLAAAVVTAYVASRDTAPPELTGTDRLAWDPDEVRRDRWLDAIDGSTTIGAGSLAWLAYQGARYDEAARWAASAPDTDGYALWVRGRLALRAGDLVAGTEAMKAASKLLPAASWDTAGRFRDGYRMPFSAQGEALAEAAGALLSQGEFLEALEDLSGTRYWLDAAYVAERVLTVDELRGWVDTHAPERPLPAEVNGYPYPFAEGSEAFWGCDATCDPGVVSDRMRWLLARRLVREGRVTEAVAYAPERHRARFEGLRDALAANAVTDAARRMRVDGMELAGTELDPDYAVFGGDYELNVGPGRMERTDPLAPSADERARYGTSAPTPDRRFHYRFVAADQLHTFAAGLPDDDPRVAWALCTAGRWVDSRDTDLARSYYREAQRRPIDRAGVAQWFSDCGREPRAPTWWWPWRRQLARLPPGLVALGTALYWWWRRKTRRSPA